MSAHYLAFSLAPVAIAFSTQIERWIHPSRYSRSSVSLVKSSALMCFLVQVSGYPLDTKPEDLRMFILNNARGGLRPDQMQSVGAFFDDCQPLFRAFISPFPCAHAPCFPTVCVHEPVHHYHPQRLTGGLERQATPRAHVQAAQGTFCVYNLSSKTTHCLACMSHFVMYCSSDVCFFALLDQLIVTYHKGTELNVQLTGE